MDILSSIVSLLGKDLLSNDPHDERMTQTQVKDKAAVGLGSLLDTKTLEGLVGSLMGAKGSSLKNVTNAASAASAAPASGMDLGGLLGSLMSAGGAGALTSLLGSGETPPPAPQAISAAPDILRSKNILRALIYSARADGHIDQQEQDAVRAQISKAGLGEEAQELVDAYLAEPLDVKNIANNITDPQEALQIFALSNTLVKGTHPDEKKYLENLANALGISPATREQIAQRMGKSQLSLQV